jgi:hypothetical protein
MAHKTKIDGKFYEISGGKTFVGGKVFDIADGKTIVGGKAYEIGFNPTIIIMGSGKPLMGDAGCWVEINGVEYGKEFIMATQTIRLRKGTIIACYVKGAETSYPGYVYLNNVMVLEQDNSNIGMYQYIVQQDATIQLTARSSTYMGSYGIIEITEQ